jgi:hypothetical protein
MIHISMKLVDVTSAENLRFFFLPILIRVISLITFVTKPVPIKTVNQMREEVYKFTVTDKN